VSGGIYVGALDSTEATLLLPDSSSAAYASVDGTGYLLFWRGGNIMAQPFDSGKLRLSGGPFPVAVRVGYSPSSYLASFSASENGFLAYDSAELQRDQLVWFDRAGKRLGTVGEPRRYYQPALSPDEKQVAVDRLDPRGTEDDLWLINLAGAVSTRFTFDPKDDAAPVWSPDGRSIAFASNREGVYDLYRKLSSGAGKEELLLKSANVKRTSDWSPDGRFLLYHEQNLKTKYGLWLLPLSGDRKPIPFLQTEFNETHGAFAPDGKSIAYQSDESGKYEIYVQTFPATGAKWQISKTGGTHPKWRGDGKELFYQGADRKMMAVELKRSGTLQVDVPHPLFDTHITNSLVRFAVTRDGQRFLIPTPISEASATPATVVLNWTAGIKR
jgi:eukaryotic-like serine/threonine-protein kinase